MPRYFTHYWTNQTWNSLRHSNGRRLNHTASNLFAQRGVRPGDHVYVITVLTGQLYLLGKLVVQIIGDAATIAPLLDCRPEDMWPARDQLIAAQATPKHFNRAVPLAITEVLQFQSAGAPKGLFFKAPGVLDGQTLRGVRELTPDSALLLDSLLPPLPQHRAIPQTRTRPFPVTPAVTEEEAQPPQHPLLETFADYFASWDIVLPDDALEQHQAGRIAEAGWEIQYVFGNDDGRPFLDFYATHPSTHDRHHRIDVNGEITDLPPIVDGILVRIGT